MNVTIRTKPLAKGRKRIYFDFYPPVIHPIKGTKTRREFLNIFLFDPPMDESQINHNKEAMIIAESLRTKREIMIFQKEYGFLIEEYQEIDFLEYFRDLAMDRYNARGASDKWMSAYKHLEAYCKGRLIVKEITPDFVVDFREHLRRAKQLGRHKKLHINSASVYFDKFRSALKKATRKGYYKDNPAAGVKGITMKESSREFLSFEELQMLVDTECSYPILKKASLFSALTGMRWGDIAKLTWSEMCYSEKLGNYIRFTQGKTGQQETLFINQQARDLLGPSRDSGEKVFKGLKYSHSHHKLKKWILDAGIIKKITFHCFRHTHATLQLTMGTDITTVSKLLGHKNLKTTQIYARVIDQKKRDAVNPLPSLDFNLGKDEK